MGSHTSGQLNGGAMNVARFAMTTSELVSHRRPQAHTQQRLCSFVSQRVRWLVFVHLASLASVSITWRTQWPHRLWQLCKIWEIISSLLSRFAPLSIDHYRPCCCCCCCCSETSILTTRLVSIIIGVVSVIMSVVGMRWWWMVASEFEASNGSCLLKHHPDFEFIYIRWWAYDCVSSDTSTCVAQTKQQQTKWNQVDRVLVVVAGSIVAGSIVYYITCNVTVVLVARETQFTFSQWLHCVLSMLRNSSITLVCLCLSSSMIQWRHLNDSFDEFIPPTSPNIIILSLYPLTTTAHTILSMIALSLSRSRSGVNGPICKLVAKKKAVGQRLKLVVQ